MDKSEKDNIVSIYNEKRNNNILIRQRLNKELKHARMFECTNIKKQDEGIDIEIIVIDKSKKSFSIGNELYKEINKKSQSEERIDSLYHSSVGTEIMEYISIRDLAQNLVDRCEETLHNQLQILVDEDPHGCHCSFCINKKLGVKLDGATYCTSQLHGKSWN